MNALAEAQKNAALLGRGQPPSASTSRPADDMMAQRQGPQSLEQLSQMASPHGPGLLPPKGRRGRRASRSSPPHWTAATPGPCAKRWTRSRTSSAPPSLRAEGRVQLAAGVSRDLTDRVKAGRNSSTPSRRSSVGEGRRANPTWPVPRAVSSTWRLQCPEAGLKPSSPKRLKSSTLPARPQLPDCGAAREEGPRQDGGLAPSCALSARQLAHGRTSAARTTSS